MILPLVVLDVRAAVQADPDHRPALADLQAWERRHGRVPAGAFVALHTGWAERWPDPQAMRNADTDGRRHSPGCSELVLRFLLEEREAAAIGYDTLDTDPGADLTGGRAELEVLILCADRYQIELLANLDRVPESGALVVASWPKARHGSGFPARMFAIVPPED